MPAIKPYSIVFKSALMALLLMACESSPADLDAQIDQPADARLTPQAYSGYVSLSPDYIDVMIEAPGDGCDCPRYPPPYGGCKMWADYGVECPSACVHCVESIVIRSPNAADIVHTWTEYPGGGSLGIRTRALHQATPGEEVSVLVSGCAGPLEVRVEVPMTTSLLVLPPTAPAPFETLVAWTPAGIADEVAIMTSASGTGGGWECRVTDSGSYLLEGWLETVSYIEIEARTQAETVALANGEIALFQAQRALWARKQPPDF